MNIRQDVARYLAPYIEWDPEDVERTLETPPRVEMGDLAFPCFKLARVRRKAPVAIAQDLVEEMKEADRPEWIGDIRAEGPYLNIAFDRDAFIRTLTAEVIRAGDAYGSGEEGMRDGTRDVVLIEFSSPNIAKPFHVGHAFSTLLGNSLYRIFDHLGYDAKRLNFIGDYGTQFGKLIVAYRRWVDAEALEKDPITELTRIYVRFHKEAEEHPELEDEARAAFRALEEGGEEEEALWKRFRDLSLESFKAVYRRLGIAFDDYRGESFYSKLTPGVVEELREKDLLHESEGAQVVDLEDMDLPPVLMIKSDGTTIYASRDVASVLFRQDYYHFAKNIYVVDSRQSLHFDQVFAVVKKMGYDFADDCKHVGFGLVKFPGRQMSTRDGDVIYLRDLLDEAVAKTEAIIRKNNEARSGGMSESEIRHTAEVVGIGAVIHTFVRQSRDHDIIFSWDSMLDFEGDTAPYLQYTYARARSILRRAATADASAKVDDDTLADRDDETDAEDALPEASADDTAFLLAREIAELPASIRAAAASYEPSVITRQLGTIARTFNSFYHKSPILTSEGDVRAQRLDLCRATCTALKAGLALLGIGVVERM